MGYASRNIQIGVAALIVFNFTVTCLQKQIDPKDIFYSASWAAFEDFFNVIFFVELLVNMYGSWLVPFFKSKWNLFDLLVVIIGVLDLVKAPMPGPLRMARMLRAFRVCRLFGRIQSLKTIVAMIHHALPGVASAFMLNLIILCIYSVLAVDFFGDIFADCKNRALWGDHLSLSVTPRGKCFGDDYYGTFLSALYSLFQVLTGESWSEAAVRPVLWYFEPSVFESIGVSIYFISFMIVNSVVLINVVVAVLIDGMSKPSAEPPADTETEAGDEEEDAVEGTAPALTLDISDKVGDRDWFRQWMHPGDVIPTQHRKGILAGKQDLSDKVASLKDEANSLRLELETTTAEMRQQLQEVLAAVRQTLHEERRFEQSLNANLNADASFSTGTPDDGFDGAHGLDDGDKAYSP
jgi:hypothetical protein